MHVKFSFDMIDLEFGILHLNKRPERCSPESSAISDDFSCYPHSKTSFFFFVTTSIWRKCTCALQTIMHSTLFRFGGSE